MRGIVEEEGREMNTREVSEIKKNWMGRMEKTSKLVEELDGIQGTRVKVDRGRKE